MSKAFDDRIYRLVFTYGATKVTIEDPMLAMTAIGSMYVNPLQCECALTVANLNADLRNQLLTQLTPFNMDQARKTVELYAGRESTGLFLLYKGDITECFASQPPDITLTIKSKVNQFWKYDVVSQSNTLATTSVSNIVSNAAKGMNLTPRFEATDKQVSNYSYTGSRIKEIDHIADLGQYDVYTNGSTLVCKDKGKPLKNETHVISAKTGMIGQPQPTEWGVKVVTMLNPSVIIGGGFALDSKTNPLLNGDYTIYKYGFQIATRDVAWYTILEATKRYDLYMNSPTALPQ